MAMTWTDILDAVIAAGKKITTGLMTDLRDNDEANSDKPQYIPVDVTAAACPTTYPGSPQATYYTYIPEDGKTLRVRAALWTTGGTSTAKFRVQKRTAPSGYVESDEQTSTAAAKGSVGGSADKTWTVADLTNVSGDDLRGEEVQVDVYLKNSTAAQTVDIEAVSWAPSRTAIA